MKKKDVYAMIDEERLLNILKKLISYHPHRYGAFSLEWNDIEMTDEERDLLKEWLENK